MAGHREVAVQIQIDDDGASDIVAYKIDEAALTALGYDMSQPIAPQVKARIVESIWRQRQAYITANSEAEATQWFEDNVQVID